MHVTLFCCCASNGIEWMAHNMRQATVYCTLSPAFDYLLVYYKFVCVWLCAVCPATIHDSYMPFRHILRTAGTRLRHRHTKMVAPHCMPSLFMFNCALRVFDPIFWNRIDWISRRSLLFWTESVVFMLSMVAGLFPRVWIQRISSIWRHKTPSHRVNQIL